MCILYGWKWIASAMGQVCVFLQSGKVLFGGLVGSFESGIWWFFLFGLNPWQGLGFGGLSFFGLKPWQGLGFGGFFGGAETLGSSPFHPTQTPMPQRLPIDPPLAPQELLRGKLAGEPLVGKFQGTSFTPSKGLLNLGVANGGYKMALLSHNLKCC